MKKASKPRELKEKALQARRLRTPIWRTDSAGRRRRQPTDRSRRSIVCGGGSQQRGAASRHERPRLA